MMKKQIVFLLIFFCLLMVNCETTTLFPTELIGTWVTEDAPYEDRYIKINEAQFIFGTGPGEPNVFFIDKIQKKDLKEVVEWTFYCHNMGGAPFDIVVFYKSGTDGGQIKLRNKEQIQWVKRKN